MRIYGLKATTAVAAGIVGLVVGLAVPVAAHEAKHVINGSAIKKHSISGNRLKGNTLTGKQIKESTLGTIPHAQKADALPPLVWHSLTFTNGWSNYDVFGYPEAGYAVDAQGIVHLRGVIHAVSTPSSNNAFTLPSSILPTGRQRYVLTLAASNNPAVLSIGGGAVNVQTSGSTSASDTYAFTGLEGITFPAG